jgi:hypothetical protein
MRLGATERDYYLLGRAGRTAGAGEPADDPGGSWAGGAQPNGQQS